MAGPRATSASDSHRLQARWTRRLAAVCLLAYLGALGHLGGHPHAPVGVSGAHAHAPAHDSHGSESAAHAADHAAHDHDHGAPDQHQHEGYAPLAKIPALTAAQTLAGLAPPPLIPADQAAIRPRASPRGPPIAVLRLAPKGSPPV